MIVVTFVALNGSPGKKLLIKRASEEKIENRKGVQETLLDRPGRRKLTGPDGYKIPEKGFVYTIICSNFDYK